jgi:hypothetical protein
LKTRPVFLSMVVVVWVAFGCLAQARAQGPSTLPKCAMAQLIVEGTYCGAQAKQQGQSYDQQVGATHVMAGKLADTYGSKVGGTYQDVEVKLLQNLYTNPAYAQMSPEQFRDAMQASFSASAGCSQTNDQRT